jgi:hypothetical protein
VADAAWQDLDARMRVVEARLGIGVSTVEERAPDPETFWVLDGLRRRPGGNGVVFAGEVTTAAGPVAWQYGLPAEALLDGEDVENCAGKLAALGHPVRLRLLLAVLRGTTSPTELAEMPGTGTSGQIYHHIRTLTTAGWLRSAGRGHVQVPAERVVPLLVALAATI